jgi:hypothetical protein
MEVNRLRSRFELSAQIQCSGVTRRSRPDRIEIGRRTLVMLPRRRLSMLADLPVGDPRQHGADCGRVGAVTTHEPVCSQEPDVAHSSKQLTGKGAPCVSALHDEFQNFGTSVIDTILSQSGKRGLWLTLAHQFTSQLDERIRDSVLGNCSTIVAFRLGSEDAPLIGNSNKSLK